MKPTSNTNSNKVNFSYNSNKIPIQGNKNMNFIPPQQNQINIQQNMQIDNQMFASQLNCEVPYQIGQGGFGGGFQCDFPPKLLHTKKEDQQKKVVAVIISFLGGASYDQLFTTVEQKSLEGTRVLVYSCGSGYIKKMISAFEGKPEDDTAKEMMEHVNSLDPDCVVFNWQCSSNYGGQNFPEGRQHLFKFLKMILDKKHMAMFSDFSLKALIKDWDNHLLGPNPFKKIGETSSEFELCFKSEDLRDCPSAQLQIVGEMADKGKCHVEAMGGTILYSVDSHVKHEGYDLKVLTVASNVKVKEEHMKCKVGEHVGAAGHVLLSFKSGGHLLTSMGHWVELMKIDTSEKKLFEIAERQYGLQKASQMRMEYDCMDMPSQQAYISKNAVEFVQNSAPCMNMAQKSAKSYAKKK